MSLSSPNGDNPEELNFDSPGMKYEEEEEEDEEVDVEEEGVWLYPSVLLLFAKACAGSLGWKRGCQGTPGLNSGISSTKLSLVGKEAEAGMDPGGSEELVWEIPLAGSDTETAVEEEEVLKPGLMEASSIPLLPSRSFSTGPEMICCRREMLWTEL